MRVCMVERMGKVFLNTIKQKFNNKTIMEATTQTDIKPKVKVFLQKRIGEEVQFSYEDDIFKLGLVNSLFALELVVFLENTFEITVENEDLDLNNFSSISNIEQFINKKKAASA